MWVVKVTGVGQEEAGEGREWRACLGRDQDSNTKCWQSRYSNGKIIDLLFTMPCVP